MALTVTTGDMRAAVFDGPGPLRLTTMARPTLEPGDVLLRVAASGICGTDLRIVEGRKTRGVRTPSVLGHEFAGTIVEVGSAVGESWATGDRVVVQPVISCGRCGDCLRGAENRCSRRRAIGYEYDGALAELVRVPAVAVERGNLARVPDHLSFAIAALSEPLAAVLNGQEAAGTALGDTVLILGGGPIGLLHQQVARARGARRIIVSEPSETRRSAARGLGADIVLDPTADDVVRETRNVTGGDGCDVVIVAVGVPALLPLGLAALRRGGHLNLFAGFDPNASAPLDLNQIHYDEIEISGSSASSRLQFAQAIQLLASGQIAGAPLISDVLPLDRVNDGLGLVRNGRGLKVIIEPLGD